MANEDDDDVAEKVPSDAYVGMIGIASVALVGAAVLLYLDFDHLAAGKAQPPSISSADTGLVVPGQSQPATK